MFSLTNTSSSSPTAVKAQLDPSYTLITTSPDIKQLKAAMMAVPSGLVSLSKSTATFKRRGKKKGKKGGKGIRDNLLMGECYNTVASRPIHRRVLKTQMITVEMTTQQTAFTTSAVATVFYANYVTLNAFSNYTEYTSLFDQYKILELEHWIEPFETQSSVQALSGTFTSAIDVDDANTPTSIAQVQDHQGSLITNGTVGHYHRWKPHMAVAVYSGAFTSFSNAPANWIDSASPAVQHYAIKCAITATTNAIPYSLQIKALVSFRSAGI